MKKLEFLKEHSCQDIERVESISIEQYWFDGKKRWFHNRNGGLNEIKYCPYCGLKLPEN